MLDTGSVHEKAKTEVCVIVSGGGSGSSSNNILTVAVQPSTHFWFLFKQLMQRVLTTVMAFTRKESSKFYITVSLITRTGLVS